MAAESKEVLIQFLDGFLLQDIVHSATKIQSPHLLLPHHPLLRLYNYTYNITLHCLIRGRGLLVGLSGSSPVICSG